VDHPFGDAETYRPIRFPRHRRRAGLPAALRRLDLQHLGDELRGAVGNAILALNKGAKAGGFAHDTGEGGISRYHREGGGDLIWEIGSGYFGCRTEDGRFDPDRSRAQAADPQVKMIELKLSQGAKPGHGGMLPAAKITPEIAEARGVPMGRTASRPPRTPSSPRRWS
jgi:glutamate synthase domain-containing protein 2